MNTICRCNPDPTSCANKPHFVRMDLDEKVESYFLHIVYEACQCYTDPVDLCTAIKQCLDQKFGPMWHVVVGPEFGSVINTSQLPSYTLLALQTQTNQANKTATFLVKSEMKIFKRAI
ncbi:Dynein light chain 1 cytoplasmic [Taenia solium]|eukprot:TsM_000997700 transcript=TsM_000997700 gene=TsM_000997700